MNRLWLRLTVAFVLVAILSAVVAVVFVNRQVDTQFQSYLAHNRIAELGLTDLLEAHYAERGSWASVDDVLSGVRGRGQGPGFGGMGMGMGMGAQGGEIVLADATGRIVAPQSRAGTMLSDRDAAVPLRYKGRIAGYVTVIMPVVAQIGDAAQAFLTQINATLVQAAALAALAGAGAGFLIARGVANPLSALALAARRVAEGKYDERVTVTGTREITGLAESFNDMTAQLGRAEVERRKQEQLRRTLVADIAHELRTPLTVMQGNLQAILDDVYPLDKGEIATIYDQTLVLRRLVNDLHELSLAEAGQLTLNMVDGQAAAQVEGAANRFRDVYAAKGVALATRVDEGLPLVRMDAERVAQVLNNLLSNALKHTPEGGDVCVTCARQDDAVRISVLDTGSGIAEGDLPHVFDRFWRADKSRARDRGGSGLGLAIAKQLVEAMGGRIGAESASGRGSTFWFTLKAV